MTVLLSSALVTSDTFPEGSGVWSLGLYSKIHDSSPVMTLPSKSGSVSRCLRMICADPSGNHSAPMCSLLGDLKQRTCIQKHVKKIINGYRGLRSQLYTPWISRHPVTQPSNPSPTHSSHSTLSPGTFLTHLVHFQNDKYDSYCWC